MGQVGYGVVGARPLQHRRRTGSPGSISIGITVSTTGARLVKPSWLASSRVQIDHPATGERTAVVDAHGDDAAVICIDHLHHSAKRQRAVGGGEGTRIRLLAARRMPTAVVDRRNAKFGARRWPRNKVQPETMPIANKSPKNLLIEADRNGIWSDINLPSAQNKCGEVLLEHGQITLIQVNVIANRQDAISLHAKIAHVTECHRRASGLFQLSHVSRLHHPSAEKKRPRRALPFLSSAVRAHGRRLREGQRLRQASARRARACWPSVTGGTGRVLRLGHASEAIWTRGSEPS